MIRRRRLAFIAWACLGATYACRDGSTKSSGGDEGTPASARRIPSDAGVALGDAARRRAGIETRALGAGSGANLVHLVGTLIADPTRVTTIQAPISGRLVVGQSGRWPGYGDRVAAGSELARVSDAKPLVADREGTVTKVGAQPGQLVQAGQVLLELTDFGEPLARIIWRSDGPLPAPATLQVAPLAAIDARRSPAGGQWVTARLVGPAADADSLTHFPMYLYRAPRGWPGAAPGTPVVATVPARGAPTRGLFVPTGAVVQWEGFAWVYVEHRSHAPSADTAGRPVAGPAGHAADVTYVRHRVDTTHPVDGGWLVESHPNDGDLTSGDAVVVRGAQQLLSEEFKSRATTVDEDEQ
jgi:biotin carboxyl carrier protein